MDSLGSIDAMGAVCRRVVGFLVGMRQWQSRNDGQKVKVVRQRGEGVGIQLNEVPVGVSEYR
jgi:hypothetical protein